MASPRALKVKQSRAATPRRPTGIPRAPGPLREAPSGRKGSGIPSSHFAAALCEHERVTGPTGRRCGFGATRIRARRREVPLKKKAHEGTVPWPRETGVGRTRTVRDSASVASVAVARANPRRSGHAARRQLAGSPVGSRRRAEEDHGGQEAPGTALPLPERDPLEGPGNPKSVRSGNRPEFGNVTWPVSAGQVAGTETPPKPWKRHGSARRGPGTDRVKADRRCLHRRERRVRPPSADVEGARKLKRGAFSHRRPFLTAVAQRAGYGCRSEGAVQVHEGRPSDSRNNEPAAPAGKTAGSRARARSSQPG